MDRKIVLGTLIIITIILPFVLFMIFPHVAIWSMLIIPGFLTIITYPKWSVAVSIALFLSALKYTAVLEESGFSSKILFDLIIGTIENYLIFFMVAYYIIKNAKLLKEVQELTLVDQLTGAYNRRYFDLYMAKAVVISERAELPIHLILLDIDHFKPLNDTYGHVFGDEVLKKITEVIKANSRASDDLVRVGGEEFAILVPETRTEDCLKIAERVRQTVEETDISYKDKKANITISLGVTRYQKGTSVAQLFEQADKALYQAKKNGRNQVVVNTYNN